MAIVGSLIALGGSLLSGKIASNRANGPSNLDADQRSVGIEDMFAESFLESLTEQERTALETSIATGSQETQEAVEGSESTVGSTEGSTDVTRGTDQSNQALADIISGGALPDGEAAIQASIDRVLKSGAPTVANAGNRAGAFDSTVGAQLENDLIMQAAQAGAATDLQQQNTNIESILKAVTGAQQGTESVNSSEQQLIDLLTKQLTDSTTTTEQTTETAVDEKTVSEGTSSQQEASQGISDVFSDTRADGVIDLKATPLDRLVVALEEAELADSKEAVASDYIGGVVPDDHATRAPSNMGPFRNPEEGSTIPTESTKLEKILGEDATLEERIAAFTYEPYSKGVTAATTGTTQQERDDAAHKEKEDKDKEENEREDPIFY